jgi:hypothetical protein
MHIHFLPHMKTTLAVHFSSASGVSGLVTPHFVTVRYPSVVLVGVSLLYIGVS